MIYPVYKPGPGQIVHVLSSPVSVIGSMTAWLKMLVLLALLMSSAAVTAETPAEENKSKEAETKQAEAPVNQDNRLYNLTVIQQSIDTRQASIRDLSKQLEKMTDPTERSQTEQKIVLIRKELATLQLAFEHFALGGINQNLLTEQPEEEINWREELEQISRPLISSLKEFTAKPRQMDALRREIVQHEEHMVQIDKALASLQYFSEQTMPAEVAEQITQLFKEWQNRRDSTLRALETATFKLDSLKVEGDSWQSSVKKALSGFFLGRGLTLLLAVVVAVSIWLVLKGMLELYWRWLYRAKQDVGVTRAPLVIYSYRFVTGIVIVLGVLMVFYIRGDVLLITLSLLALAGVALSLRQTLPRYAAELRLLLGIGPVREDERLVYEGVPYKVVSLSVFSILRNPLLEGILRLPLHDMSEYTSRHPGDEPWFPCKPEDYILLSDGSFGRVLRQTIEMVELMVRDTRMQIGTADFIAQNIRNLSKDGFGVAATFGIDYLHQEICLEKVPDVLRDAIVARFDKAGLKDAIKEITVEFKQAGASSLDYQVYIILNGTAAKAYFKAQRLVQQGCVDACNREGWIIPFTQITVHNADYAESKEAP